MASSLLAEAPAEGFVRAALRETAHSLRLVFGHRALRRIQLALAGSLIGDRAYATAVAVWAYGVGGAKAVGVYSASRYVLMAVTSPFVASLADRLPRKWVMVGADLTRCVLVVAAAACVRADAPAVLVFVLAIAVAGLTSVFRPAQAAWLPSLVDRPEDLTASNGVASTLEGLAFFVGPALGASLLAVTTVSTVFLLNAVSFLWSAALIVVIRQRPVETVVETDDETAEGTLAAMLAGFREIRRNRDLRLVASLLCAQTLVAGASVVFTVLFATRILATGPRGVGFVDSVYGVGAIVGGFVALARAPRGTLARDLAVGVMLWSLPLLFVTVVPSVVAVFMAAALLGFANPVVDVNFDTAVQRITPDRVLGRVFGALEGAFIAAMALGAAVMPLLVDWLGLRASLAVLAVVVGVPAALSLPAAIRLDRRLKAPAGLELLRLVPIFAPLGPVRLDALARQLDRLEVPAGSVILKEGERGDRFYVIATGSVTVSHGAEFVREEGPGEYFGEIALLRDLPRTASVTAAEDTVLFSLARAPFLDAVSGHAESSRALEDVVSYRMRF